MSAGPDTGHEGDTRHVGTWPRSHASGHKAPTTRGRRRRRGASLTSRELEVLQLVCAGYSSREIAQDLDLSVNTVFVHRANIMNALDIHKASRLVAYAIQQGLVAPG
jgi:DNA-binding NarL/FixJ family response regulator